MKISKHLLLVLFAAVSIAYSGVIKVPGDHATISAAIASATSGDTILVAPGTYDEAISVVGKNLVIRSDMDGLANTYDVDPKNTIIDGGSATFSVSLQFCDATSEFAGFTVTKGKTGIYLGVSETTVKHNIITDVDYGSINAPGIRVSLGAPRIIRNLIYHVGGQGISCDGDSISPKIFNNTIYDYGYYAGIAMAALATNSGHTSVFNNIVKRGNTKPVAGIVWSSKVSVEIGYNNVHDAQNTTGVGGDYAVYTDGSGWGGHSGGDGKISADPMFVGPDTGNFYLSEASTSIDAATPFVLSGQDTIYKISSMEYVGDAPDMGAYEAGLVSAIDDFSPLPQGYALEVNYPNPFNPTTTIPFSISVPGHVQISIYNTAGQKVVTVVNRPYAAGNHKVVWNGSDRFGLPVSSGVYFLSMRAGDFVAVRRITFVK